MKFFIGLALFLIGAIFGYMYGHTHAVGFLFVAFILMLVGGFYISDSDKEESISLN